MARREVVVTYSDVSGDPIPADDVQVVRLAVDGTAVRLDLTSAEADKLLAQLAPYLASGASVSASEAFRATPARRRAARQLRVA